MMTVGSQSDTMVLTCMPPFFTDDFSEWVATDVLVHGDYDKWDDYGLLLANGQLVDNHLRILNASNSQYVGLRVNDEVYPFVVGKQYAVTVDFQLSANAKFSIMPDGTDAELDLYGWEYPNRFKGTWYFTAASYRWLRFYLISQNGQQATVDLFEISISEL